MASRSAKLLALLIAFGLVACGGGHRASSSRPSSSYSWKKKSAHAKKGRQYTGKVAKQEFIWPANGTLNSPYGPRWGRMHDGIDIGGDSGDPIYASAAGEVVFSGKLGGYGNLVVIKHPNGFFTAYGHNKKILVSEGQRVKQGQTIARMGRTGTATGDHCHFEIRDQDGTYDPYDILVRAGKGEGGKKLKYQEPELAPIREPELLIADRPPPPKEPMLVKKHPDDPFNEPQPIDADFVPPPAAKLAAPSAPMEAEVEPEGMMQLLSDF